MAQDSEKNTSFKRDEQFIERFDQESRELIISRTRYAIGFSIFIYPCFGFLDYFASPEQYLKFIGIRLGVVACYLFILFMYYNRVGQRFALFLSVCGTYASALGIAIMTPMMGGFQSDYYIGILLIIFVSGLIMPWKIRPTLFCGGLILVSYLVINFTFAFDPVPPFYSVISSFFFITGAALFAAFGNYSSTKSRRKDLGLRMQIESAAEELKALDEAKTRFFSNVSHELRTPLTLILGPLDSILQGRESEQDIRPLLSAMSSNARRLLRQVNALLDFSKLDAGKLKLNLGNNNLGLVLRELVEAAAPHAEGRQIFLGHENCEKLPDSSFDLEKIETVAANLISNALKFTENGGRITVSGGHDEKRIWFEVEDTGAGIPADRLNSIFNRFEQIDDSMSRKAEGTGLGLAMVRELTKLHRGNVTVTSKLGQGTTFHVEWPLNPVSDVTDKNAPQTVERAMKSSTVEKLRKSYKQTLLADITVENLANLTSPKKKESEPEVRQQSQVAENAPQVLLVEDNPDLRSFVARALAKTYRIHTAKDGLEGLELAQQIGPDLIVSDLMMPRMNGSEFCQAIRKDPALSRVPFILVTAKSGAEAVVEGLAMGANDYVTKPFDMRELEARIFAHLRAKSLESSLSERDSRLSAIGQMTSSIVHDLSNPAQSVIGTAQVAQIIAQQAGNDDVADRMNIVVEEANRLCRMIQEVLDFARGNDTTLQRRPTKLKEFIDNAAVYLTRSLTDLSIELIVEHDPDDGLTLDLDQERIRRVLENLVKNARQALLQQESSEKQKRITISTYSDEKSIYLRVADNGPGIPEDIADTIFNPFSTKGKEKGTGLGLSTVRNLMKAHGGEARIDQDGPEEGAVFILSFPIKQEEKRPTVSNMNPDVLHPSVH